MQRAPVRDFVVGLFVLAGLAAIAYLSITIGGFSWHVHGGLKVSAVFDETGDLTVRAPVVIAGVKIGEVTAITLDKDFRARVSMNLEPNIEVPRDGTFASIVTAGMLGDRYIELSPGFGGPNLQSGDQIAHTESAMILEKLLGQLVYGVTKGGGVDSNTGAATSAPAKP